MVGSMDGRWRGGGCVMRPSARPSDYMVAVGSEYCEYCTVLPTVDATVLACGVVNRLQVYRV